MPSQRLVCIHCLRDPDAEGGAADDEQPSRSRRSKTRSRSGELCGVGDLAVTGAASVYRAIVSLGEPVPAPEAGTWRGCLRWPRHARVTTLSAVAASSSAASPSAAPPRDRPRVESAHRLPRASCGDERRPLLVALRLSRHPASSSRPRGGHREVVARPFCTSREDHLLAASALSVLLVPVVRGCGPAPEHDEARDEEGRDRDTDADEGKGRQGEHRSGGTESDRSRPFNHYRCTRRFL